MTAEANQAQPTAHIARRDRLPDAFKFWKAKLTGPGSAHPAFCATLAVAGAVWAASGPHHFIEETWAGFMLIATLGTLVLMVPWFKMNESKAHALWKRTPKQRKPVTIFPYLAD